MIPCADEAWPLTSEPADEWAGDEWLDDLPSNHLNHLNLGGKLDAATYAERDRAWLDRHRAVLRGELPPDDPTLHALGEDLLLLSDRTYDRRPARVAPEPPSPTQLTDVVADYLPDLGMLAPDRFLGPWADVRPPRAAVAAVAGNLCFLPLLANAGSPLSRWMHSERPKPSLDERRVLLAVERAPPMLYRPEDDGTWTPLLPLGERLRPAGRVRGPVAPLTEGSVEAVVARVIPLAEGGWWACCALGLPLRPPLRRLEQRLDLELQRLRRHERRATWEDLLRRRPEVLYRFCAACAWWRLEE